jgi:hypothetical protein
VSWRERIAAQLLGAPYADWRRSGNIEDRRGGESEPPEMSRFEGAFYDLPPMVLPTTTSPLSRALGSDELDRRLRR